MLSNMHPDFVYGFGEPDESIVESESCKLERERRKSGFYSRFNVIELKEQVDVELLGLLPDNI